MPEHGEQAHNDIPPRCLQIFTKAPSLVSVKTRLSPVLSSRQRQALYLALLRRTLDTARRLQQLSQASIELWCTPSSDDPILTTLAAEFEASLHRQQGADLGARMLHALNQAAGRQQQVVLIGSDCPFFTPAYLEDAFATLESPARATVLGPAEDGGFVLLGSRSPLPLNTFSAMRWGCSSVLENSYRRLKESGHAPALLPPLADIDRPDDLAKLDTLRPPLAWTHKV